MVKRFIRADITTPAGAPRINYPGPWYENVKKISVHAYDDVNHYCLATLEDEPLFTALIATGRVIELSESAFTADLERLRAPGLQMSLHETQILSATLGAVRPLKVRVFQDASTFDIDCFVTQDLVDAYTAGKLAIGDWVLVYFIDQRIDKAIAQQKIFKTW